MKAIHCGPGSSPETLTLREMPKPIPRDKEVLVRVEAASVTRGDLALRQIPKLILVPLGLVLGFKPMRIPGVEFSGVVEAVGKGVSLFKVGDGIMGTTTGLAFGANAEYVCVPERRRSGVVALKPEGLSHQDCAVLPVGGMTALQNLARLKPRPGYRLMVYGAAGSVGSYAVQLGAWYGAEVTAVCGTANQELASDLGAARALDYTAPDWPERAGSFDGVFDAVGKLPRAIGRRLLVPGGRWTSVRAPTSETDADLALLIRLASEGQLKPLVDRIYTLAQVPDAHRYVGSGRKRGNLAIQVRD